MTDEDELEMIFAQARGLRPEPDDDLMARLMADALREMPGTVVAAPRPKPGWRDWMRALGGWPALGGLAAATVAGFWIGLTAPAGVSALAPGLWGEDVSVALGVDEDLLSLLEG
ncbi:hypothetical protein [Rubellimicrobium roseum]|nr:hypothetical protein [Rubellimicrobium roseum]